MQFIRRMIRRRMQFPGWMENSYLSNWAVLAVMGLPVAPPSRRTFLALQAKIKDT
jgi:hypothetical protein